MNTKHIARQTFQKLRTLKPEYIWTSRWC